MSVAAMRIAKTKSTKGMTPLKIAEKLSSSRILSAKKREGVAIWTNGEDKLSWLESVLGHALQANLLKDISDTNDEGMKSRLVEIVEVEELARLEDCQKELEKKRASVNDGLDALAARSKLLQLAYDRIDILEPIREEEVEDGNRTTTSNANKKGGKGKKNKEEESNGQPRCGYDERLSWDDARLQAWSHTKEAKDILEERIPIDGILCMDDDFPSGTVAICGKSKRKCKRHSDWSNIRSTDVDVERETQSNILSVLTNENQELTRKIDKLKAFIRKQLVQQENQRRESDALLAKQLANEGTRRASTINGH